MTRTARSVSHLLTELRRLIGHEPNDLGEMEDDNGYPLKDEGVVAVVYVYSDGKVSWYQS